MPIFTIKEPLCQQRDLTLKSIHDGLADTRKPSVRAGPHGTDHIPLIIRTWKHKASNLLYLPWWSGPMVDRILGHFGDRSYCIQLKPLLSSLHTCKKNVERKQQSLLKLLRIICSQVLFWKPCFSCTPSLIFFFFFFFWINPALVA